jgi:hypothetical protein
LIEEVIKMGGEIADGNCALSDPFVHKRSQTVAAGVVLHPSCLKGSILAIVGKDE